MTHVALDALTKIYDGQATPAVDRLSLDIASGEFVALLGPSGCGKTTALKMIAGLLEPTSGGIAFDGRSVLREKPENRGAVMMFQAGLLFPHMTVADNIGFGLKMRGAPAREIASRVREMMRSVRLPELGGSLPAELSGGQQQRVALARALIVKPQVLLLDEPLSNLDAHLRVEMRDLIRSLQRQLRITTIFVTHDQEEAVVLADRIALILNGRLRQYDRPEHFYRRPADAAVARFFGGRNFVEGRSDGSHFHSAMGLLRLPSGAPSGACVLTFRPEAVRIGIADENVLNATLSERVFVGTRTRLMLQVRDVIIEAATAPEFGEGVDIGSVLTINLPPAALWVLPPEDRTASS